MDESRFVQRDGRVNVRDIDKGTKNKFVWSWMDEKDESGQYFSDYIRKVKEAGKAFCLTCKEKINYSSNGKKSLYGHAKKTAHVKARNALKQTQSLPAVMMATKALESCIPQPQESKVTSLPYGTSSSIADFFKKTYPQSPLPPKPEPVPVGLTDRKSHQEALICSFIAEHDLPLSIAPSLASLAQELSKDPKSLNELKLDRSSATYKLKYGVHLTLRKRLLHQMRNNPFSFNVDESTSKTSKKRVLNVLVCYFNEEKGESITDLYCSLEMTTVNAKTVHAAIMGQLEADGIPLSNLMSLLSDSAAYMRGKHNGVQALLKGTASHLADVGGDTCHTIHNAVKSFCSAFDKVNFFPQLLDDIYNDFHFSADLREELRILLGNLDLPYLQPLERISHRWLSIYDTTERLNAIFRQLTLFYFAFLSKSDQTLYQDFTVDILKNCNKNAREQIKSSIRRLQSKSTRLTKAGTLKQLTSH